MESEQSIKHASEKETNVQTSPQSTILPMALQPFAVQLLDIVPTEIIARRFPVTASNHQVTINVQFNIIELGVDTENLQAQTTLEVKVEPFEEPHIFEIHFNMVAFFTYGSDYTQEMVSEFLQQGSLSLMLPFARELVLSLSTRLHLPPIVLSLIQLASPSTTKND